MSTRLLYAFARLVRDRRWVLGGTYDLLVDGFPRCGNSYTAAAFKLSQPNKHVRSHGHHPAFVVDAIRSEKPVCLVIREPKMAVTSLIIHRRCSFFGALDWYCRYYSAVLPFLNRVEVVEFSEVLTRFPDIIRRINNRYNIQLDIPIADKDFHIHVKEFVEQLPWAGDPFTISLPNRNRRALQQRILRAIQYRPQLNRRLENADEIYHKVLARRLPA